MQHSVAQSREDVINVRDSPTHIMLQLQGQRLTRYIAAPLHYLQVCCVKTDITKELEIELLSARCQKVEGIKEMVVFQNKEKKTSSPLLLEEAPCQF